MLAFLVSIGTIAGVLKLTTSAIEGSEAENAESDSSLTVDVSDTELTIELADDPVFAVLPVDITVEEAKELARKRPSKKKTKKENKRLRPGKWNPPRSQALTKENPFYDNPRRFTL